MFRVAGVFPPLIHCFIYHKYSWAIQKKIQNSRLSKCWCYLLRACILRLFLNGSDSAAAGTCIGSAGIPCNSWVPCCRKGMICKVSRMCKLKTTFNTPWESYKGWCLTKPPLEQLVITKTSRELCPNQYRNDTWDPLEGQDSLLCNWLHEQPQL